MFSMRIAASIVLALTLPFAAGGTYAASPRADFLFVGSYHMDNPGRDVVNVAADDVLAAPRQREIEEVARALARYRPTRVMVEVDSGRQAEVDRDYAASCRGERPLARNEVEQLGFRIACAAGLDTVFAVDAGDLAPGVDLTQVDYQAGVARHGQQSHYDAFVRDLEAWSAASQQVLAKGSVLDMLRRLNSDAWLATNARSYHEIGLLGTQADPVGARWVRYWFGRNLAIFNSIVRNTEAGDRVLVIYGAGHGNHLRQLAADSGDYRVHAPLPWLAGDGPAPQPWKQGREMRRTGPPGTSPAGPVQADLSPAGRGRPASP